MEYSQKFVFPSNLQSFWDYQNTYIIGAEIIVRFILVTSLTNIPERHSGKYANDFSSYFRNNGIQLRKFILNTIYSGLTVRTSLWLMDDKNKVLPRWIEPCVYIHKLCSDSLFHIKFLHNVWFHLTLIPIQLDPRLSDWIFQLKKYNGNIYKYWLQFRLLELKHMTWHQEITWEVELPSRQFRVWYFCKVLDIF